MTPILKSPPSQPQIATILQVLKQPTWWILAAWSFPLVRLWQVNDPEFRLSFSNLVLLAAFIYLWRPRPQTDQSLPIISLGLAIALLLRSTSLFWFETDLWAITWWIFNLILVWLCLGFKQICQYWRQFLLLNLFLAPLSPLLAGLLNLRIPTAIAATFGLHYLGFEASRLGSLIFLPQGVVDVNQGCTALDLLIQTYRLLILLGMAVTSSQVNWFKIHLAALGIPFIFSVVRVMLLVVIVRDRPAFDYWHTGGGSNWFALGSLLLTGFCWLKTLGDQADFTIQMPTPSYLSRSRQRALSLIATLSVSLLIASWFNPQIGSREVADYKFPTTIAHSQSSQTIPTSTSADRIQAAQTYQIPPNLTLNLQYLLGTRGNLVDRYQNLIKPNTKITNHQIPSGTYHTWQQDQTHHLSTCLFSDRTTRVAPRTLKQEILEHPNLAHHLIQWLQGQIPLRDRRCIWIHAHSPSPQTLLNLWPQIYSQLTAQFPPL